MNGIQISKCISKTDELVGRWEETRKRELSKFNKRKTVKGKNSFFPIVPCLKTGKGKLESSV